MDSNMDKNKTKERGWEFLALSVFNAIIGVSLVACPTISFTESDPLPTFALWFQRAMCLVQAFICGLVYHFARKLRADNSYSWHCKCCISIAVIVAIGDFISIIIVNFVYVGIMAATKQGNKKDDNGLEYLVLFFVGLSFAANILTIYECRIFGNWIKEHSKNTKVDEGNDGDIAKMTKTESSGDIVDMDKTGSLTIEPCSDTPHMLELETQNSVLRQEIAFLRVQRLILQYDEHGIPPPSTPPPRYSRMPYLETEI